MYERIEKSFKKYSFMRFIRKINIVLTVVCGLITSCVILKYIVQSEEIKDLLPALYYSIPIMLIPTVINYIEIVIYLYSRKYINGFLYFFKFETNYEIFAQAVHLQDIKLLKDILFTESITTKDKLLEAIHHYQQEKPRKTIGNSSFLSLMALTIAVLSLFYNEHISSSNTKIAFVAIIILIAVCYAGLCTWNKDYFVYLSRRELLRRIEASLSELYFDYDTYFPDDLIRLGEKRYEFLFELKDFLNETKIYYNQDSINKILERKDGQDFSFKEHVKAYIYSLLNYSLCQSKIESNCKNIDKIFFEYSIDEILKKGSGYYMSRLQEIKCCNNKLRFYLSGLIGNLRILKRNVGFDGIKSDECVRKFLGLDRMHFSRNMLPSKQETFELLVKLSQKTGFSITEIDKIIWLYCSANNANICTEKPNCNECVIKKYCIGTDR